MDRPLRQTSTVQSLDRAFDLLQLMGADPDGVALTRLAAESGLPVPTIHRLVRTLVASGYVLQLPSRRYALGPRLIGLGERAPPAPWTPGHARTWLSSPSAPARPRTWQSWTA